MGLQWEPSHAKPFQFKFYLEKRVAAAFNVSALVVFDEGELH